VSISRRLLVKALFSRNPSKVLATAGWRRTDVDGVKAGYAFARAALGTDGLLRPAGSGRADLEETREVTQRHRGTIRGSLSPRIRRPQSRPAHNE
jgi:hypothetical protein